MFFSLDGEKKEETALILYLGPKGKLKYCKISLLVQQRCPTQIPESPRHKCGDRDISVTTLIFFAHVSHETVKELKILYITHGYFIIVKTAQNMKMKKL